MKKPTTKAGATKKTKPKAKAKSKSATLEPKVPKVKSMGTKLKSEWWKFQKGRAKTGGRVKGTPNKINAAVADALSNTYEGLGGDEALKAFALDNPDEFFKLWVKMLPKEIKLDAAILAAQVPTMTVTEAASLIHDFRNGKTTKPKKKTKTKTKAKAKTK